MSDLPRRVLLSGGIGSGKSTVGRMLEELGARVVDADRVGHAVLREDPRVRRAVADRWPEVMVEGEVDRARLAEIVFDDPEELRELEDLTHPAIRARLSAMVAEAGEPVVVVEVPLNQDFLGPGWERVVVDAPRDVRVGRLTGRGMDTDDVRRRMASQPDREEWLDGADHVISNSGTLGELRARVEELWKELTDRSACPG